MKKILIAFSFLGLLLLVGCGNSKNIQNDEYEDTLDTSNWEDTLEVMTEEEDSLYMEQDTLVSEDTILHDTLSK